MDAIKEQGILLDAIAKGLTSGEHERDVLGHYFSRLLELRSQTAIQWERPFQNSFKKIEEDTTFRIWNGDQIKEIVDTLKVRGVILSGGAGTGKGYIARNIGFQLTEKLGYKSVLYSKIGLGKLSPNLLAWGKTIKGNYELGIILEGALVAKDNPDSAVIVHLDEITRSDFLGDISTLFDFLSEKGKSSITLPELGEIIYPSNLFIVCTANEGAGNKTNLIQDQALIDRLRTIPVIGVFENEETFKEFLKAYPDNISNTYKEALLNISEALKNVTNKNWYSVAREISTRRLLDCMNTPKDIKEEDLTLEYYYNKDFSKLKPYKSTIQ
jgi:MoxR-like ATPase